MGTGNSCTLKSSLYSITEKLSWLRGVMAKQKVDLGYEKESKIPKGYQFHFKFYDNEIGKDCECWYNPTEKNASKAYIKKVLD